VDVAEDGRAGDAPTRGRAGPRVVTALVGLLVLGLSVLCAPPAVAGTVRAAPPERSVTDIVPVPVAATADPGADFRLSPRTVISAVPGAEQVAQYLGELLRPATGFPLPVEAPAQGGDAIALALAPDTQVGAEGYRLAVDRSGVRLTANTAHGLFNGVQSLRQLLPSAIEARTVQHREWTVAGGTVVDHPRFAVRGAMLDVARHFFAPDQVKLYIDQIAQYKVNTLHLHLTDDQGWRIEIRSRPNLSAVGGATAVGGAPGGSYTQAQYRDIVAHAQARYVTVVPEIDVPGHTNAALASYAELNCDGVAVPPRTDTAVGYSSLCIAAPATYRFVEDVVRELAALTPGPYLHIGGDEAHATPSADYLAFERAVQPLAARYGKKLAGWHDIAGTGPPADAILQYWGSGGPNPELAAAAARGNKILMSPAAFAYLDMKYTAATQIGQTWAGLAEVDRAYGWDPASLVDGVGEERIAGVEAPLWTETVRTSDDIELMAFPRLAGIAEIGWSPRSTHDWASYRARLGRQGPRWVTQGIDFYRSPQVDWA
jgi:hexosaminidase